MASSLMIYTFAYLLLSSCIACPPTEFVSLGLTVNHVFARFLGSESEFFVQYHVKRSIATLLVHSVLPFGYVLGLIVSGQINVVDIILGHHKLWLIFSVCALAAPLFVMYKVLMWSKSKWSTHPIAKNIAVYCNNNSSWLSVTSDVNIEFRRIDKIIIEMNTITKIVVTDNWIIKVTPYKLYFAHQSDTALVVNECDTHPFSMHGRRERVQYLNVEVNPTRPGAEPFVIRLNALNFKDFQDKIKRPIVVLENVVFHRTLLDRFIDIFKEQVAKNQEYETAQELDQCVGCMQAISNVKLNKLCDDSGQTPEVCVTCYCRPMWCVDCMAKWFASRQDESSPETWLSSKCTCPVCRAKFCMLDVSYVRISQPVNS